ncbi:MAG TPA: malectin domain-containing carbohydrate-binding protein [Pseudobdellovibrionaceae bacterium]
MGNFVVDQYFSGGMTYANVSGAINVDTSGVLYQAPQAVYHCERYGNFSYTIPGLTPGVAYEVRLHFVEGYWQAVGQRIFNVSINGTKVLSNFDIFATAGSMNKAVLQTFLMAPSSDGTMLINFTSIIDNAKVDGIEVLLKH